MERNRRMAGIAVLLTALFTSLIFVGGARAQGQSPAYAGQFTLTSQIHWGRTVLQPGKYTITIESKKSPVIALIRNADGDAVTYVVSGSISRNTNGLDALLIKERNGQLIVHSFAVADMRMSLIYDPTLAREKVQEARLSQTVPVIWAKK